MKGMEEEDSSCNNNNSNWLGFSLSSHLTMDAADAAASSSEQIIHGGGVHHHHVSTCLPTSSCLSSSSQMNSNQGFCYGGYNSPLTIMPLKSDGSLCIMDEAFNNSQPMCESFVPSHLPPKLEDFLGGAARETMPLSLDSIYYQNNREQQQEEVDHMNNYFSGFSSHGIFHPPFDQFPQMGHQSQTLFGMIDAGTGGRNAGNLQSLTLSMSPGSQSSCVTAPAHVSSECLGIEESKKRASCKSGQKQTVHRKSIETFGQRTSQYRGVTRHRWTGRYEAHLWDNSCKKEGQTRKGRQVYLGGYDMEDKAARAYDLAALKYWGPSTHTNFPSENYREEVEEMKNMSRQEYVSHLRRKSSGFSRGASIYRGVTRHHQHGRWQARIGRVAGNKDLYLGTFSTQEEAAEAYDIAAIKFRGANAVTNFDITKYDVEKIMASNTLLAGELARRIKDAPPPTNDNRRHDAVYGGVVVPADQNQGSTTTVQPVEICGLKSADGNNGPTNAVSGFVDQMAGVSSVGSKFIDPTAAEVASWFPTAAARNSVAHLPVVAAWQNT